MWSFIISGYVPGTNIQLSYEILATFFAVSGIVWLFFLLARDEKRLREEMKEQLKAKSV